MDTHWMASAGEYADYRLLIVFARQEDATAWVAWHNSLDRFDQRRAHSDPAFVEPIPFCPAGVIQPAEDDDVIDVEIVPTELEAAFPVAANRDGQPVDHYREVSAAGADTRSPAALPAWLAHNRQVDEMVRFNNDRANRTSYTVDEWRAKILAERGERWDDDTQQWVTAS